MLEGVCEETLVNSSTLVSGSGNSTSATIEVTLFANDKGGSGLNTLQYAWSNSNTVEPTDWKKFINGDVVSKTDCVAGTYYLWTKVIDNAGNRATDVKTSNPFIVQVVMEKGDFVEYDVSYIDCDSWNKEYEYTTKNGWRLLSFTDNGDGTYSDVMLISTGIPADFPPIPVNGISDVEWYIKDTTKLNTFKELLGGEQYTFYTGRTEYYALEASAGLYYNFGNVPFSWIGGSYEGSYESITIGGKTYDIKDTSGTYTANTLFNTGNATIRLLTLPELNKALGRNDVDDRTDISTTEDPEGIYRLDLLKNVQGMSNYVYTSGMYWLASPSPDEIRDTNLCSVYGAELSNNFGSRLGVRPVICMNSDKITFDLSADGTYYIMKY